MIDVTVQGLLVSGPGSAFCLHFSFILQKYKKKKTETEKLQLRINAVKPIEIDSNALNTFSTNWFELNFISIFSSTFFGVGWIFGFYAIYIILFDMYCPTIKIDR